jgi:hypothetical protein
MLKDKISVVRRHPLKICYEVSAYFIQENYYEKKKLVGQGTFGKVYQVETILLR